MADPRLMPEGELQNGVFKLCSLLGIWWYHVTDSRKDRAGFPDLVLVGRRGGLFRELKREDKNPTAIQSEVGLRMSRAGWDWDVWRPSDLASGRVLRELEGIR